MARRPRIHYPGAFYHVMLRGNDKQTIFRDKNDIKRFETILSQALEEYRMRLYAYCWMKNHSHMAIQVSEVPLAKMMQILSQRYTGWFNHRYDRVGHLFQGRYKAILVDDKGYLFELIRYIHLNPVRADLVTDPRDYQDSSHICYLAPQKAYHWISVDPALKLFGTTEAEAQAGYLEFMGQEVDEEDLELLRKGGSKGRILGDDDFLRKVLNYTGEQPVSLSDMSLDELTALVAEKKKISSREIVSKSMGKSAVQARAVIALLAVDYAGCPLKDVAQYFGRDSSNMSRQVKKFRNRLTKDSMAQKEIESFIKQIENK
jgi:REP element-mobilizing transposase RayT